MTTLILIFQLRRKNPPPDKTAAEVTPKKGDSVRLPGPLNNSQDHISPSASQNLEGKLKTFHLLLILLLASTL